MSDAPKFAKKATSHRGQVTSNRALNVPQEIIEQRSFEETVKMAERMMEECNPSAAALLYEEALTIKPGNTTIMDKLGEILYDLGEEDRARDLFMASIKINPEQGGYSKWMHIGQLTEGKEAVEAFHNGIQLIEEKLNQAGNDSSNASNTNLSSSSSSSSSLSSTVSSPSLTADEKLTLHRELSNAYCSIAEVYMTDLCDEDEAEEIAEQAVLSAMEADGTNPEAYSIAASVRMSQSRNKDAVNLLKQAYKLIEELEENELQNNSNSTDNAITSPPVNPTTSKLFGLPTHTSRLNLGRMCMELELYQESKELFDTLLAEDDTVMEIWFLLGECYYHLQEYSDALDVIGTAQAMVKSALDSLNQHKPRKGFGGNKLPSISTLSETASNAASNTTNNPVEFTADAISTLIQTPVSELSAQYDQFTKLLGVIQKAIEENGGTDNNDDDDEEEDDEEEEDNQPTRTNIVSRKSQNNTMDD